MLFPISVGFFFRNYNDPYTFLTASFFYELMTSPGMKHCRFYSLGDIERGQKLEEAFFLRVVIKFGIALGSLLLELFNEFCVLFIEIV